jgi:hypothetical protein
MPDHTEYESGARKLQGMPETSSAKNANPEQDAEGQSEDHHSGGENDGVSSANPRVLSGNDDGDATFPFKKKKDEERSVTAQASTDDADARRPAESFPPFDDPAFSAKPAQSPVQATAPSYDAPRDDTEYAGHPDFSQDAASNKPPKDGMGLTRPLGENSEETRQSDAQGPSVADPPEEITKDDVDHRPL